MATAKKNGEKTVTRNIEYTKSFDSLPRFYVNNTNATVTNFDLRLTFGQVTEISPEKIVVDPQTIIFMSPEHAKAVVALLAKQLAIFESNNGPIPQPKETASSST